MTNHSTDRTAGESADGNATVGNATAGASEGSLAGAAAGATPRGDGRALDATSRNSIENRLKSMYDEVASEPVPDRFLDLLNKLERSEGSEGGLR